MPPSGAEAFGLCAGRIYDLAFVDLKLPDMSGVAVAEVMKKKLPNLFVVLMSGFAASIDDPELPRRWTDAILPKPWRPLELDAILRNFVGVAG